MLDHGHADVATLAGHDIEASGREAGFIEQAGKLQSGKRRVLGRFGDDRAAGDQRSPILEVSKLIG